MKAPYIAKQTLQNDMNEKRQGLVIERKTQEVIAYCPRLDMAEKIAEALCQSEKN